MKSWSESSSLADWNRALQDVRNLTYTKDAPSPSFAYAGQRGQIPRLDLPYGTLRWQGSSGDRAVRTSAGGAPFRDYYKVFMPSWAFALTPAPLSADEQAAIAPRREATDG